MQTTQDVIKLLPFHTDFKDDLLKNFDTLNPDQKFAIERVIWEFYDALFENRLDENMKIAFEKAKKKEVPLDHEFYTRVRKETEQQLKEEFSETEATVDLSEAREKLQEILDKPNEAN
jgi:hypothetical protein